MTTRTQTRTGELEGERTRKLDERDLLLLNTQITHTEDRSLDRWERYMREAELHAVNHHNEHLRDDEARRLALGQMDKRLEGMNEFRVQLKEQAGTFATITNMDLLRERVNAFEKTVPANFCSKDISDMLDKRLDVLEKYQANMQGRLWAMGAGIGAIVVIVNLAIKLL